MPQELPLPLRGTNGLQWTDSTDGMSDDISNCEPWPRITLITPSYNQGQFIEDTIRSVLVQNYPNLEYIIIDGGSTDESVEIIRRYESSLAYWCSEKDKGQADAINKGFARATGSLLGWINSDDILLPGALHTLGRVHTIHEDSILAGAVINFDQSGPLATVRQKGLDFENFATAWKQVWEQRIGYHQPGVFFPKTAWDSCGPLDRDLSYCFDSDLMYRLVRHCDVVYLDKPVAGFRLHESSKTVSHGHEFEAEADRVLRRYWSLEGRKPDLKSYSSGMGAKCAACFKQRRIEDGITIAKRGIQLYPLHTFLGFLKAVMMKGILSRKIWMSSSR